MIRQIIGHDGHRAEAVEERAKGMED